MNIEAFCASRQLQAAVENFTHGRLTAAFDNVRRAKHCVDKILKAPPGAELAEEDEPHADNCLCRSCHEAMLERL